MSTRNDPLLERQLPDRLFYATGMLLDQRDFEDEQTYHRNRLARALAYLHGSGTAAGLRVSWAPPIAAGSDPQFPEGREGELELTAGLAIDRLGRLIEVPRRACIRLKRWFDEQEIDRLVAGLHSGFYNGVVVDLFIRFVACERGKTPAFASGPFDATNAAVPSRVRDAYELKLFIRPESDASPVLLGLNPAEALRGSGAFQLTLNGLNFVNGSIVRWNGVDRLTTFASATQLVAQIPAADLDNSGTAQVTVFNPEPGGESNALSFNITEPNPVPVLSNLNPNAVMMGGPPFTLIVSGSNFVNDSVVRWNGNPRLTTFVSATQLVAQVPAADLVNAGTAQISVFSPAPGGGASNAVALTIVQPNPAPTLTAINPNSVLTGNPAFTLTVNGTGFINGAVVRWNGNPRPTTFVSATQLTAQIPAADLANAGTAQVTVFNPAPGGGASNAVVLTVVQPNPLPTLTALTPNEGTAGSPAFTLTVNGTGFVNTSVVRWNGNPRPTIFVSPMLLTVQIPAAELANTGTAQVTVFNPLPGGGVSGASIFTIHQVNPSPTLGNLNPNAVAAGSPAFSLTVNGTGFVNDAVVRWNGADRPTTFVSTTQLVAQISAADLVNAGTAQVTVFNPAPGGGASNVLSFSITQINPVPTLANASPPTITAGGPTFTLTVNGVNFVNGAVVRWNGTIRTTAFVSSLQLTAQISSADIANAGTAQITVLNPAPGGGTSSALVLTIAQPNPTPALTSLAPNVTAAGGPAFTLTVNGTSFVRGAVVRWNGANRQTTFISATQLTAQIPATDLANVGVAQVSVFNPTPGGGASNVAALTIAQPNPTPKLSGSTPNVATAGSPAFSLTVNGTGFVKGAIVRWNGGDRPTTFVNESQLTAQIPAVDLASEGAASITVFNPAPGGGVSNAVNLAITKVNNPPTLSGLNPISRPVDSPSFNLAVKGTGFVRGAVVLWNGEDRPTDFVSATQLVAQIPATDLENLGRVLVSVLNPNGGLSNSLGFTVTRPIDPLRPRFGRDSMRMEVDVTDHLPLQQRLPVNPWPDLAAITDPDPQVAARKRREALREAIFNAWAEESETGRGSKLLELAEHLRGQDPTFLFLARLVIPAAPAGANQRPVWNGQQVEVQDEHRLFVYTPSALARAIGL
ncbi:MAG: hypothetical protein L0Y58_02350 [Verrucomicrobia subdivision 3 bacterium]|nr:hypothetical protein [Limisphaerales bacterium]